MPAMSKRCCAGMWGGELKRRMGETENRRQKNPASVRRFASSIALLRSRGRRAGGSGFGFSAFQDLLADVLGCRFDVLHLLADARAGGFVAAHGFIYVLFDLGDQL